jgi:hypothetical protein
LEQSFVEFESNAITNALSDKIIIVVLTVHESRSP